jgi:hypothetical protein
MLVGIGVVGYFKLPKTQKTESAKAEPATSEKAGGRGLLSNFPGTEGRRCRSTLLIKPTFNSQALGRHLRVIFPEAD